jgi:hypothetical protein
MNITEQIDKFIDMFFTTIISIMKPFFLYINSLPEWITFSFNLFFFLVALHIAYIIYKKRNEWRHIKY